MVKILSLDGGGIRSVGFVRYLCFLEKERGTLIRDQFEGFSGTSSGAILAVLCSLGYKTCEILELSKRLFPMAFKKPPIWKRWVPFGAKYQNINLRNALLSALGENAYIKMSALPKPVYITTCDMDWIKTKVFDNKDDVSVIDALECSCAAPSYFDPMNKRYIDGSVWANNPSLVGALGYINHFPETKVEEIELLSIGHGESVEDKSRMKYCKYFTLLNWADILVKFLVQGHEEGNHFYCRQLPFKTYKRIEVDTSFIDMDDVHGIELALRIWENYISKLKKEDLP